MIELYYWPTPNGHKITLMLEETGLDYKIHQVNISTGEQHAPDFLKISPNNRMPAIVDTTPGDGGAPLSIFESGAILLYLVNKTGRFGGKTLRERIIVDEWLFWQVGGLGPMAGQYAHFTRFAPEQVPYAINRYTEETQRLFGVLERRLAVSAYLGGAEYSIADMASYPWVLAPANTIPMDGFPKLTAWTAAIKARPATVAAYARAAEFVPPPPGV
jgi:GST-like protein